MDLECQEEIVRLINRHLHAEPISLKHIGGGFYGKVYLAEMKGAPHKIVVKVYSKPGLNVREQVQLTTLAKYATLPMPKVYFIHDATGEIPIDALVMEYLEGHNAGNNYKITPENRKKITDQIIDNLIAYHSVTNPDGFGDLNSDSYYKDWNEYYKPKVDSIFQKATAMHDANSLDDATYRVVKCAYENYDKIFSEKITYARLIHGDYNTWNVMLGHDLSSAVAVIDPFNCCWADSELDLYQLNNANGKGYGLLDNYKTKVQLSKNFEIKNRFYELFTEIMHFYDAGVDLGKSNIPEQARGLGVLLDKVL